MDILLLWAFMWTYFINALKRKSAQYFVMKYIQFLLQNKMNQSKLLQMLHLLLKHIRLSQVTRNQKYSRIHCFHCHFWKASANIFLDDTDISWSDVKMTFSCHELMTENIEKTVSTNRRCSKILAMYPVFIWTEEYQRQSLTSPHQTIPLLPLQAIPSIFTFCSLFSLCSPVSSICKSSLLPCLSFTFLLSLLIVFNIYLFLACPPLP